MADKVALITGVTGQDGAYFAELLLSKGYVVHGVKRRSSSFNTERVQVSFEAPEYTANADALRSTAPSRSHSYSRLGKAHAVLSGRHLRTLGLVREIPQRETTPFYPRLPYGVAKLYGFWI